MGQEFGQPGEWNHDVELPWALLADARHQGVQRLVRDLNALYRGKVALHRRDCEAQGFEWIAAQDADLSILAWARHSGTDAPVLVVCNFTPVPRYELRLGVPNGPARWRETLNTDSAFYGGSDVGNDGCEDRHRRGGQPRPRAIDSLDLAAAGHAVPGTGMTEQGDETD